MFEKVKNDIEEYLNFIDHMEEARLVAKLIDYIVPHPKYKDVILTLFDKPENTLVQMVIANR